MRILRSSLENRASISFRMPKFDIQFFESRLRPLFPVILSKDRQVSHSLITSLPLLWYSCQSLTLIWPVANLVNTKYLKNYWNPVKWVLIWEYSVRAFRWIPTWQGLDIFQKSLRPCALGKSSLSIWRVNARSSKQADNVGEIFQEKAELVRYLKKKCYS